MVSLVPEEENTQPHILTGPLLRCGAGTCESQSAAITGTHWGYRGAGVGYHHRPHKDLVWDLCDPGGTDCWAGKLRIRTQVRFWLQLFEVQQPRSGQVRRRGSSMVAVFRARCWSSMVPFSQTSASVFLNAPGFLKDYMTTKGAYSPFSILGS